MKRIGVLGLFAMVFCGGAAEGWAGGKGVIVVRALGAGAFIAIDGDFSDWPLGAYETVSEQPLFPEGQDSETTDARGDHIVYDPDRVGFFNTARGAVSEDDPDIDFEVDTYFAFDDEFLYILSVFVDDQIENTLDTSNFGSQPFLNDGFEFFVDSNNDSDDCIAELQFPAIDGEAPNLDDFQIGTGLNDLFDSALPLDEGGLGAVQGVIRAGDLEFVGASDFSDGRFQEAAAGDDGPAIGAKEYPDLREAGAPNDVIEANPDDLFTGYAIETRIPFGIVEGFSPDHPVGFTLFWRDVDPSSGGSIQFIDWAQSTSAGGCATLEATITDIFYAPNWGALEFDSANPLTGTAVGEWSVLD